MKRRLIIFLLLVITSCAEFNRADEKLVKIEIKNKDYIDHLASLGPRFLASDGVIEIKQTKELSDYLNLIYQRIQSNNEVLLSKNQTPKFYLIKNKVAFIFSLPGSQFFISSGLIEKYLKNEELFIAALSAEILKSNRNVYEKKLVIPTGDYNYEKIIALTRLKMETKQKLNEWTYVLLKRAGHDSSAYLNWIQIQNRNILDFSVMNGELSNISREEQQFKNFMSKQGIASVEKKIYEGNSSKAFYKLLNRIVSEQ